MLEAQRAHLASDDHIRREVEAWRDATPAERLAELAEMCRAAEHYFALAGPVVEAIEAVESRYPAGTIAIWERMQRAGR